MSQKTAFPDDRLVTLATVLGQRGWRLASAESCTGGMIAARCTDLPGSSAWFDSAVVSYSNQSKVDLLGVPQHLIQRHGAVSEFVVRAMAEGMLARSAADIVVAVSGVAGPDGGTGTKPVGTVWLAWALRQGATQSECRHFPGGRAAVRSRTLVHALENVIALAVADESAS
jgi:nicotinamide-nucleotide amidase